MPRNLLVAVLAAAAIGLGVAVVATAGSPPTHDPGMVATTPTAGVPAPQYPRASQKTAG